MKPSRANPTAVKSVPQVLLRGKWQTIAQAGALAKKEEERGNGHAAAAIYELILAKDPKHIAALFNQAMLMRDMGKFDEAVAGYRKVIAINPNQVEAYNNLGRILSSQGKIPEAEQMFRKALALKPDCSTALYNLIEICKYEDVSHADIKAAQAMLDRPGISQRDTELLYYSLGKIYDECGHYDEAFAYYQRANHISNSKLSYSAEKVTEATDRILEVFNKDFLAKPCAFGSEDPSPLFIVGMPRSGTSLLAQILSNHPRIASAGELSTITDLTLSLPKWIGNDVPYPEAVKHITPAVAARLISDYQARLQRDAGAGVSYIIDKLPLNLRDLGFIAMLFPKAKILHCTRHPFDTALSIYFQQFGPVHNYSFDLQNIGHFYGQYARIMEHWRAVLPLKMIEINYEKMILNTESVARLALDFLGLEWNDKCLAPHTNPGVVFTASHWQVRQPIYTRSVGRWRCYEKHLGPLQDLLSHPGVEAQVSV